jgi:cellulose synthase (UDP-forming)
MSMSHLDAQPALGVIDEWTDTFTIATNMTYEEIWDWWNTSDTPGWLLPQLQAIRSRHRLPIVTVEPWPISSITKKTANLLPDIMYGKYDNVIRIVAADIKQYGEPVIVRWGHEMESGSYPWSRQAAPPFIAAFQHVAAVFKNAAPNIAMMWSPVGDPSCQAYYPGAAVVDYVGLSVYNFPTYYGYYQSFAQLMNQKYPRVSGFGKPVFAAELGDQITDPNQARWVSAMLAACSNYPLLKALIWFNAKDSSNWGTDVYPDWEVSPTIF